LPERLALRHQFATMRDDLRHDASILLPVHAARDGITEVALHVLRKV